MKLSLLFRTWWVILIQGILMILVSIIIFNNPVAVLTVIASWLGIIVIVSALVGMASYYTTAKEERDIFTLLGSIASLIIGILMLAKILVTIKAITLVFGLLASVVGLVLVAGSWGGRKQWSLWWTIAIIGICGLVTGIKSCMNIYSGAESISNLYGVAVLISGVGLVFLAILKKKIITAVKGKIESFSDSRS